MSPEQILGLRAELRWPEHQFGRALGVSQQTVSRWERGDIVPNNLQMATLRRMRHQLDARLAGLSRGIDVANDWKTILIVGGLLAFLVVLFSENK